MDIGGVAQKVVHVKLLFVYWVRIGMLDKATKSLSCFIEIVNVVIN